MNETNMLLYIILFIYLLIVYLLSRRDLVWGISFLLLTLPSYLLRLTIIGIPTTFLELGIYLVFVVYLIKIWQGKEAWRWRKEYWLVWLWIVIGLVNAWLVSDQKLSSLGLWKGWFVDPALIFLVMANSFGRKAQMTYIYNAIYFLLGILGLVSLVQYIFVVAITPDGRVSAFFQSANYLAMLVWPLLVFVFSQYLFQKKFNWWQWLFILSGLAALFLSASYVGIISLLTGMLMVGYLVNKKQIGRFVWPVVLILAVGVVFVVSQIGSERFSQMIDLSQRSSVTVRLEVWRVAWEMVGRNLAGGVGLGNFEEKYLEYAPLVFHPPMEWKMLHAHNLFLHTWVELGIFGFLTLTAIILYWWTMALKLVKKNMSIWWVAAIIGILLGWVIGGMLDTPYYKNDLSFLFWLFFGLVLATDNWMKRQSKVRPKNI